jgi:hypothetical protein
VKKSLAFLALLLASCLNDESLDATSTTRNRTDTLAANTEIWEEMPDPNLIRFAGSDLELRLGQDSIEIVQTEFTDFSDCRTSDSGITKCSPFSWSFHYLGTFTRRDSTLSIHIRYSHTDQDVSQPTVGKDSVATFRLRYSSDSSQLQMVLLTDSLFLNVGSHWQFQKLNHRNLNIVNAEVSDDCGDTDGPETRLTFNTEACKNCSPANESPYSFYLGYQDVDDIASGNNRYVNQAWRCGNQGCTDSVSATIEFFKTTNDSVSGRITLRNGIKLSTGLFTAPKKRQRPMCG